MQPRKRPLAQFERRRLPWNFNSFVPKVKSRHKGQFSPRSICVQSTKGAASPRCPRKSLPLETWPVAGRQDPERSPPANFGLASKEVGPGPSPRKRKGLTSKRKSSSRVDTLPAGTNASSLVNFSNVQGRLGKKSNPNAAESENFSFRTRDHGARPKAQTKQLATKYPKGSESGDGRPGQPVVRYTRRSCLNLGAKDSGRREERRQERKNWNSNQIQACNEKERACRRKH